MPRSKSHLAPRAPLCAIILSTLNLLAVSSAHAAANSHLPPTISGSPTTSVVAGSAYSFTPSVTDADSNKLWYSIANKPSWASFSTGNGSLSGTPTVTGTYANIVISVSDGKSSVSLPAFAIAVVAPNRAPQISGMPGTTLVAGNSYNFQPYASDPDGNTLGFSIQNKPVWAGFSTMTGALSGTPASTQAGVYGNILITVSDGMASTTLPAFAITVDPPPNSAPRISGMPATTASTGSTYAFTPTATDADGDKLTFSVSNLPSWASFNTATGQLSGTPAATQAGTYSSITIAVSDGKSTASLPAFAIAVAQASSSYAVTLSWLPPTQNTDGSVLTNLAGYRIVYGTNATTLNQAILLNNPGLTAYMVENLSPATYYFAVKAVTTDGIESDYSAVVSKQLN